tara:strand:- start:388 stop:609 length:222 start_codon:yes stop_codon:yes gene_type:complete
MITLEQQVQSLYTKLEEEPYTFQYWLCVKKNGWWSIKDKNTMKVVKKCKTKRKAHAIIVANELLHLKGETNDQ